jgi:thermitase
MKKIIFLIFFAFLTFIFLLNQQKRSPHQWALEKIQASKAWTVSEGKGAKIAVIDSGFTKQTELSEKIVDSYYFDPKGNPLKDEVGHGTETTSVIGGKDGVCPKCQLILIKLGENPDDFFVGEAIIEAIKLGANVINLSVITPDHSDFTQQIINEAWEKGIVLIASAGNNSNSQKVYPAAYDHVLAIAATNRVDRKASFSSYGSWVMAAAPGVDILTSQKDGQMNYKSGTSFAGPIAAGVAGLIWASEYGSSNESVVKRLCSTADKIRGTGKYWQCGRINAAAAVGATQQ